MKRTVNTRTSRRKFLLTSGCALAATNTMPLPAFSDSKPDVEIHEASFYLQLNDGLVKCELCPRNCEVPPGRRGHCGVRENRNGKYYSLVYGHPVAKNNDPIEKKPFFHVYPGTKSFSIATVGCNFHCSFCQNWDISQKTPEELPVQYLPPEDIARLAKYFNARTVAYTYNEPTIFAEYIIDCAKAAEDIGIKSVMVSNGYINEEAQKALLSVLTAYKVDLKAFSQEFYGKQCGGQLKPVLETLKRLSYSNVWFEIVVLIIPTLNDNMDEIKKMSEWIIANLGTNVPVHFTRFHPEYKLQNIPPTPEKTLMNARKIAMSEGCNFVYTGNMPGSEGENTLCPSCKSVVIRRYGSSLSSMEIDDGKCKKCGSKVPGVWK